MACKTCNGTGFVSSVPEHPELKSGCPDLECGSVQPETQEHNARLLEEQKRERAIK